MCFQNECLLLRKHCHSQYNVVRGLTVGNYSYACMRSILAVIFQCVYSEIIPLVEALQLSATTFL